MDAAKIQRVKTAMDEEILPDAFNFLVKVGDIPYRANRQAMVEIDLNRNIKKGLKRAQEAIAGIDGWIGELELFRDASQRIAKEAAAVFRSPEDSP